VDGDGDSDSDDAALRIAQIGAENAIDYEALIEAASAARQEEAEAALAMMPAVAEANRTIFGDNASFVAGVLRQVMPGLTQQGFNLVNMAIDETIGMDAMRDVFDATARGMDFVTALSQEYMRNVYPGVAEGLDSMFNQAAEITRSWLSGDVSQELKDRTLRDAQELNLRSGRYGEAASDKLMLNMGKVREQQQAAGLQSLQGLYGLAQNRQSLASNAGQLAMMPVAAGVNAQALIQPWMAQVPQMPTMYANAFSQLTGITGMSPATVAQVGSAAYGTAANLGFNVASANQQLAFNTGTTLANIQLGQETNAASIQAAQIQADAMASAANSSMWGSIIGGALGGIGSIIGGK
jgi:hypothetical protein